MDIAPQVGDLVRVGRGTVPWRVSAISMIPGLVALYSTNTAMQRSEMVWNLSPFPLAAVESAPAAAVLTAAGRAASRSSGRVGWVVGGVAVAAAAGGAFVVRLRRDANRKDAARPAAEVESSGGDEDATHGSPRSDGPAGTDGH